MGYLVLGFVVGIGVMWWMAGLMAKYRDMLCGPALQALAASLAEFKSKFASEPKTLPAIIKPGGLGVLYTLHPQKGHWIHHISLSLAGKPLAESAAHHLATFIGRALNLKDPQFPPSSGNVRHIVFILDDKAHQAYMASPAPTLSVEQAENLFKAPTS